MASDFEELYPNVTIELSYQAFAEYSSTINLILSGNNSPDIVELGQGNTHQAPLVAAGLLRPIDDYSALYGWDTLYPGVLRDQNSVADDGLSFGNGKQYAVPLGGNIVGVYYNQTILDQVGIELPLSRRSPSSKRR